MKILVTGGAGFIGSHLCERLAADPNNEVWSLDNYSTGSVNNHVPGVVYVNAPTSEIHLIKFVPEIIYHLGEYSRVEQSFMDIEKVWTSNMAGTLAVLEFVTRTRAKIVYAGSSTKFADGGIGSNQSPYAFTKASNTQLVQNYGKWFGIDYAIAYFYNAFGEREISTGPYATLIAKFCDQYRRGEELTVVSPGTQKRNFTHVDDIVDGLILVGKSGHGDGYGIGNDNAYTVLEIAEMFGGGITMLPPRMGNRLTADVVTSKTIELGWCCLREVRDYITKFKQEDIK